jgi:hypothetical protein
MISGTNYDHQFEFGDESDAAAGWMRPDLGNSDPQMSWRSGQGFAGDAVIVVPVKTVWVF